MTQIYRKPITTEHNHLSNLQAAYKLAGVETPNHAVAIEKTIRTEPTTAAVAAELARESLSSPNPEEFYEDALERIQRAQAAEALQKAFGPAMQAARREALPEHIEETVAAVSPAFTKLAAEFSRAAAKLPATDPLSPDAAIENDTTRELKAARSILAVLGTYVGIRTHRHPPSVPVNLANMLPILELPNCKVEQQSRLHQLTHNEGELAGTRTVRKLAADLGRDVDAALIGVAAGRYEGIKLSLATHEQLLERVAASERAYTVKVRD